MLYFLSRLQQIEQDKTSGSMEILEQTIQAVEEVVSKEHEEVSSGELKDQLKKGLLNLFEKHHQFTALFHFINELLITLDEAAIKMLRKTAQDFIIQYRNKWDNVTGQLNSIALSNLDLNNKRILLHSNSKTVTRIFEALAEKNIFPEVWQTESRPNHEGEKQAERLAKAGFTIQYITDAAAGKHLPDMDLVMVGADSIFHNKFMNKTGTWFLALACRESNVPFYVAADTRKLLNDKDVPSKLLNKIFHEEEKGPEEIWNHVPFDTIKPINFYFENIPNKLVTAFITEDGLISADKISKLAFSQKIADELR